MGRWWVQASQPWVESTCVARSSTNLSECLRSGNGQAPWTPPYLRRKTTLTVYTIVFMIVIIMIIIIIIIITSNYYIVLADFYCTGHSTIRAILIVVCLQYSLILTIYNLFTL